MKTLKTLTLSAAFITLTATTAFANDIGTVGATTERAPPQISRKGDLELSCNALSSEAANMREIISNTQNIKDNAEIKSHGVTAAGAVGSFLIGSVTGGIGLAVGGFLIDHNIDEHSDKADEVQDIAEQRRTLMVGIHNAKGCFGPIEHAMQNPEKFEKPEQLALNTKDEYQPKFSNRYNN